MIFAPTFAIQIDAEGVRGETEKVTQALRQRMGGTWEVEIITGGRRGGVKNALIARAQANRRRDPFYINRKAKETIKFLVNGLTSVIESTREMAAKQIGDAMLISIGENVQKQANKEGSGFTPLTSGYALRKKRKFGFTTPILKATGDLLGGLRARITHRA